MNASSGFRRDAGEIAGEIERVDAAAAGIAVTTSIESRADTALNLGRIELLDRYTG
jgi:hypothetical protein